MSDAAAMLTNAIADAIYSKIEKRQSVTMPATYMGRDSEGKGWARLPGAESPTPIKRVAVEAAQGDVLSVTISNGRAVATANLSNPAAGLAGVKTVEKTAKAAKSDAEKAIDYASAAQAASIAAGLSAESASKKADEATADALIANTAANAAITDAGIAHQAADEAVQDAAIAKDAASRAQESADDALESARDAAERATAAGISLSEVENVVGTLNWIAQHGSFVKTQDAELVEGKLYYTLEGGDYALTTDTEIADHKQYYGYDSELEAYYPITEPDVSDIETYYERSGMTVTKVDKPNVEDIDTYFEAWVGDSVQNYIASHLWLDDYGLNLTVDASYALTEDAEIDYNKTYYTLDDGVYVPVTEPDVSEISTYYERKNYRLHEGTVNGTRPMGLYVLDEYGTPVSMFGESVQIGSESGAHVSIEKDSLDFMVGDTKVAYVAIDPETYESTFYMTKAVIVQDLRFSDWQWKSRGNRNLSLKWLGGEM